MKRWSNGYRCSACGHVERFTVDLPLTETATDEEIGAATEPIRNARNLAAFLHAEGCGGRSAISIEGTGPLVEVQT